VEAVLRDLTELFEPVIESMGYELVGVEFNAAGNVSWMSKSR